MTRKRPLVATFVADSNPTTMKKTVWTFGLISGVIMSAMMAATIPFTDRLGYDKSLVMGYTSMVLAFLLVYFGIRSYRDNVGGGSISFGRAFAVGLLITVIASACYTATWEVMFFRFMPDFLERHDQHQLDQARAAGRSEADLAKMREESRKLEVMYRNPLVNSAFTFIEPFPVGVLVTLVSAGVLRRRRGIGERARAVA